MSSKLSPWLLSLALCAVAAQAADTPPPPVIVQKPALSAQGADLKVTLAVDKLKVSMLQGDDMGGPASAGSAPTASRWRSTRTTSRTTAAS